MPSGATTGPLARPSRLALFLSAIILAAYFGFILLSSLARTLMGTVLIQGISVGLLFAAMLLVLCIVLSLVFVIHSNRTDGDS